eukprot:TRINITY_DN81975_c0_g1_i1.p1 TRINITY_DN81975_c0_g1~~TRINITY_DN81975_c0_g1_i1.p1  ORF type:complete len:247 (+),score=26.19 TRINITY_DN81975_c0_g1_i1:158-898(+)
MADTYWGHWGEMTANQDWCEPNYVHSHYIAEYWNTLSSIPIFATGLFGALWAVEYRHESRILFCFLIVAFIGLGSVAFHSTLTATGQLLDELGMIYAGPVFLYSIAIRTHSTAAALASVGYCLVFTAAYFLLPQLFVMFVCTYVAAVVLIFVITARICLRRSTPSKQRRIAMTGYAVYAFAFLIWNIDVHFCEQVQWMHLHAWFHLLSALGPYFWVVFAAYERCRITGRHPVLRAALTLPYVAVDV